MFIIDTSALLCNNRGSKKGISRAITEFVRIREKDTYSTFPLRRLIITGAAIAVGASAVMNAASAMELLN